MLVWRYLKRLRRQDGGMFALLTLLFFAACGISTIFILWGIAQATGIYNVAYFATQSAARSAAGTATPDGQGGWVICREIPRALEGTSCAAINGKEPAALAATIQSLNATLNQNMPGNFGVVSAYSSSRPSGSNSLFLAANAPDSKSIEVYNVDPNRAGDAQRLTCNYQGNNIGTINYRPGTIPGPGIGCWTVSEKRRDGTPYQAWPWQYQSGVVVRTETNIGFPLNCTSGTAALPCISLAIRTTGAARIVTTKQPKFYEVYDCYGYLRDLDPAGPEIGIDGPPCSHDSGTD